MSPRARSDGPVRTFYKRTAASKTPPRRTAGMPRSPRLLPGGGRTTPSRSPRSDMRPRLRSGDETPLATFSKATSATIMTPESDLKARISTTSAKGSTKKTPTHDLTAATISSASKARKPALDVNKPSTAGGKAATGSKRVPKREPSFFGAELPKPQTSGTTRFPTATTASISSVLFPGGVPHDVSGSTNDKMPTFGGVGSGEEGVIRAGESVASSRRAGDGVGKARSSLRNGLGGPGKSRMTRSISMLGPGDYQKPY
ncbi:hypothetical protein M408DRAFT_233454 [Serendipita vermifera MAFF 305830]|uniref:Uncharacterized protein n=1 Tax=Serendipita vermifera MAFF 305830 TaxID=933852 RepID=A0A0C3AID4_SERVB|nr:hypothetical protein M408DRAFT_233454 [Serendipita vermifera MAFF 305830]